MNFEKHSFFLLTAALFSTNLCLAQHDAPDDSVDLPASMTEQTAPAATPAVTPAITPAVTPSVANDDDAKLLAEGVALHRDKKTAEAIEKFEQVLRHNHHNAEALFDMGVAKEAGNHLSVAADYYQRALKEKPDNKEYQDAVAAIQGKIESITHPNKTAEAKKSGEQGADKLSAIEASPASTQTTSASLLSSASASSSAIAPNPVDPKSTAQEALLNNAGTTALNMGNFQLAIENYKAALKLNPTYKIGLKNLAIAYNNLGLKLQSDPPKALAEFHQAFWFDNSSKIAAQNIAGVIKLMGLNPDSSADRAKLAQQAKSSSDGIGFKVEDAAAQWLTAHPGQPWTASVVAAPTGATGATAGKIQKVNFAPFMAELQRKIKKQWFPPKGEETKRVGVIFKLSKQGTMSNLLVSTSSGSPTADQAALTAVEKATPYPPLPDGAPKDVDIQFTFDYNVFAGKSGAK